MRSALILGITGHFGREMGKALAKQGWNIKSIVRNLQHLRESQLDFDIIEGDYQDAALLDDASNDVELIVYAVNPLYHQWHKQALAMLEPVVQLAEKKKLHILFPGNVYNFRPDSSAITESTPADPVTAKGQIRVTMESRLRQASGSGARVTIIRGGDFMSRHGRQWLDVILKKKHGRFTMRFPHASDHRHFWSYLPDLCANAVQVIDRSKNTFEIWHDPGFALTQRDWQQAFAKNGDTLRVARFPWWIFSLLSLFVPLIREVMQMRYLWQQPLILDGSKLKNELGHHYQHTRLEDIIKDMT
ncbi:MAG: hypothetical protein CENE_00724 [Candidatus Celerinatantimonas neptuna]|nr:MAG: hypothetical protein CENE_00724 [Candidatus Celerinatantimonas neptuna]